MLESILHRTICDPWVNIQTRRSLRATAEHAMRQRPKSFRRNETFFSVAVSWCGRSFPDVPVQVHRVWNMLVGVSQTRKESTPRTGTVSFRDMRRRTWNPLNNMVLARSRAKVTNCLFRCPPCHADRCTFQLLQLLCLPQNVPTKTFTADASAARAAHNRDTR